jgi:aconitase A
MLGRASWMRLPDIVGVELTGKRQPGITATDIVLALTEFLRKEKVVGRYLEFYGEGAASLTLGDRATISNMAPEYGATAAMFSIDQQTLTTCASPAAPMSRSRWWKPTPRKPACGPTLKNAEYERVLTFDLSSVVRNMAGPSNPHRASATSAIWRARHCRRPSWTKPKRRKPGPDAGWRGDHCRHHQLHQHQQPAQRDCRRPAGAQRQRKLGLTRKPWVKSSLAPGSKLCELYLKEAGLLEDLEALGFGIVAFACTTCNGMSGALDPKSSRKSSTAICTPRPCCPATAISMAASTPMPSRPSWPRRRWWWPMPLPAPCVLISSRMCWQW